MAEPEKDCNCGNGPKPVERGILRRKAGGIDAALAAAGSESADDHSDCSDVTLEALMQTARRHQVRIIIEPLDEL